MSSNDLKQLTKEEMSLLLFLETQAVDFGGLINTVHMNGNDHNILSDWTENGFVESGRVCFEDIEKYNLATQVKRKTMWVRLSQEAFDMAHAERKTRAERMWGKRSWRTTQEYNGE